MLKTTTVLATIVALGASAVGYLYMSKIFSEVGLMQRFPDIDPDVVIRAHREILRETYRGLHKEVIDLPNSDREGGELDQLFLAKVAELTK